MQVNVKSSAEIRAMRESGRLLAVLLRALEQAVQPNMTTKDLAEIAKKEMRGTGGHLTLLGYLDFPDVLCISLNDEIVHGVPSEKRIIKAGDIVSIDCCITYDGMITDAATSVIVPGASPDRKLIRLLEDTKASLYAGISVIHDGIRVGDISAAIEEILRRGNYGIVRDLVGHGVGYQVHEDPEVPNYGKKGTGPILRSGTTIAIEPMATLGDFRVYIDTDGWTIKSNDRSWSAHFEHTVLVTDQGYEILTQLDT